MKRIASHYNATIFCYYAWTNNAIVDVIVGMVTKNSPVSGCMHTNSVPAALGLGIRELPIHDSPVSSMHCSQLHTLADAQRDLRNFIPGPNNCTSCAMPDLDLLQFKFNLKFFRSCCTSKLRSGKSLRITNVYLPRAIYHTRHFRPKWNMLVYFLLVLCSLWQREAPSLAMALNSNSSAGSVSLSSTNSPKTGLCSCFSQR